MKIKISFTVDIDVEAWQANYGTLKEYIRDDVKVYVENTVTDQLQFVGVLTNPAEYTGILH